jgi:hypothetical protein
MVRGSVDEEDEIRRNAWMKEVNVFRSVIYRRPHIDWSSLMNVSGSEILPGVETEPFTAADIQYSLNRAVFRIKRQTLYPSMSKKLVPSRAQKWLANRQHLLSEFSMEYTPASFERIYILSGAHLDGPAALKQRWYLHGIQPRTYANSGETGYFRGRHLKDVWNILWNSFEPTERFKRVDISRIRRASRKYSFAMYDLTTFTSNLETHRDFVRALASDLDIEVEVVDGRYGYVVASLKEMLEEYADNLCSGVKWYDEAGVLVEEGIEDFHAVAGLLGIIGNIASCGLAHGFFLRALVEGLKSMGVAGDDAIFIYLLENGWKSITKRIEGNLGILAQEKVYSWEDEEAVYLKRGLKEDGDFQLSSYDFIMAPRILDECPHDLARYREGITQRHEPHYLKRLFVNSLGATFKSAARFDEHFVSDLRQFLRGEYLRLDLPLQGSVPSSHHGPSVPFWAADLLVPNLDSLGNERYVDLTYTRAFEGRVSCPVEELPYGAKELSLDLVNNFLGFSDKHKIYLERLGVLEKSLVIEERGGFDAIRYIGDLDSARRKKFVYRYKVVDRVFLQAIHPDLRYVTGCQSDGTFFVMGKHHGSQSG